MIRILMTKAICVPGGDQFDEMDAITMITILSTITTMELRKRGGRGRARMLMSDNPGTSVDLRNSRKLTSEGDDGGKRRQ